MQTRPNQLFQPSPIVNQPSPGAPPSSGWTPATCCVSRPPSYDTCRCSYTAGAPPNPPTRTGGCSEPQLPVRRRRCRRSKQPQASLPRGLPLVASRCCALQNGFEYWPLTNHLTLCHNARRCKGTPLTSANGTALVVATPVTEPCKPPPPPTAPTANRYQPLFNGVLPPSMSQPHIPHMTLPTPPSQQLHQQQLPLTADVLLTHAAATAGSSASPGPAALYSAPPSPSPGAPPAAAAAAPAASKDPAAADLTSSPAPQLLSCASCITSVYFDNPQVSSALPLLYSRWLCAVGSRHRVQRTVARADGCILFVANVQYAGTDKAAVCPGLLATPSSLCPPPQTVVTVTVRGLTALSHVLGFKLSVRGVYHP